MKSDPLITFRRKPANLNLPSLEAFAETLRARVSRGREFHCLVTGDSELARLNKRYREKDGPTDVLSFPMEAEGYVGDLAISLARARSQARQFGHSVEEELRILMLH